MARTHTQLAQKILLELASASPLGFDALLVLFPKQAKKTVYDALYRLQTQGYITLKRTTTELVAQITEDGLSLYQHMHPTKDGVWKLIIFDIPESKRKVRDAFRGRLKALHFKKWQTSIWVSPYVLDPEIEAELKMLAQKYFVRLIKTTDINYTKDLEQLFK